MHESSGSSAVGVLAVVVLAGGCAASHWTARYPDVAATARAHPEAFAEPALAGPSGVEGLAGSYAMHLARGLGRASADLAVAVRRPADLDIAVLAPTGAIQAQLQANNHEIGVSFLEDRVVYRGPASRVAFERALGLQLSAAHAVAAILGYAVPADEQASGSASWDAELRRVRYDTPAGTHAWLHPLSGRFERVVHGDALQGPVTATFQSWLDAPPIPSVLRLTVESEGYAIELALSGDAAVNPAFPSGFFEVQVPAGFEVRSLEQLAGQGGLLSDAAR